MNNILQWYIIIITSFFNLSLSVKIHTYTTNEMFCVLWLSSWVCTIFQYFNRCWKPFVFTKHIKSTIFLLSILHCVFTSKMRRNNCFWAMAREFAILWMPCVFKNVAKYKTIIFARLSCVIDNLTMYDDHIIYVLM